MKKSLIIILSIFIISSFLVCVNVNQILAYDFEDDSGLIDTGFKAGYEATSGFNHGLQYGIGKIISAVLAFLGVAFLILMIYGGYIWMMARGNEQEIEKAKNIIKNALIGLVVVLAAYAVTWFITSKIYYDQFKVYDEI